MNCTPNPGPNMRRGKVQSSVFDGDFSFIDILLEENLRRLF